MHNQSRKHHYIPEFYLKGFTGSDGKLAVYDLKKMELRRDRVSPSQIYFEYDRNTFEINGIADDLIERAYQVYESMFGSTFKKIREQHSYSSLDNKDVFNMALFIGMLYWRVPKTDSLIHEEIKNISLSKQIYDILNIATNGHASEYLIELSRGKPEIVAIHRIHKPIIDYCIEFDPSKTENWCVYHRFINERNESVNWHLVGDNPIIFRRDPKDNFFGQECIMNISNGKTLYHSLTTQPESRKSVEKLYIDCLIFLQSERYVCGPDATYLKFVADSANELKSKSPNLCVNFLKGMVFGDIPFPA